MSLKDERKTYLLNKLASLITECYLEEVNLKDIEDTTLNNYRDKYYDKNDEGVVVRPIIIPAYQEGGRIVDEQIIE
jgi:hypothetical protein